MNSFDKRKGFTLLELLIVVTILTILISIVIVVLKPDQLLAQARDGQRIADLKSIYNALNFYINDVSSRSLGACANGGRCTFSVGAGSGPFGGSAACAVTSTVTAVDGSGWVDVNLGSISGGSPLARLPIDPTNNATYFYGYMCENTDYNFELTSRLESKKYRDLMRTDGGEDSSCSLYTNSDCFYEIGTDPGLNM